ncbi:MAG TPA: MBL fold metallo-hydrolase, partial [Desulfosarcina sp.]|nr:MBL fold metallo-hydrolase [Desulfosarcina sp.]
MAQADRDCDSTATMVCMLASGSKGNCIYIGAGDKALLVDAGLSGREIERRLGQRHLSPDGLQALVVTHEHTDHIRGVGVLARRYRLPVYISAETESAALSQLGRLPCIRYFRAGASFSVPPFTLHPFPVSHDAADPVGFTISRNGCRIGIATDLGVATGLVKDYLKDCHLLVIEANHDPDMLINGPYPWPLKQRIKSRNGHLSNDAAEDLLRAVMHTRLKHVVLGHLSETNNTSRRALEIVGQAVGNRDIR